VIVYVVRALDKSFEAGPFATYDAAIEEAKRASGVDCIAVLVLHGAKARGIARGKKWRTCSTCPVCAGTSKQAQHPALDCTRCDGRGWREDYV
jgi:DnaJ-class molecular chaperone